MSGRIHGFALSGLLLVLAGCAKQGSVLSQVAGNASTAVGSASTGSACSSASNALVTYYPTLPNCTSAWGAGNCSLVVVAYNGANHSCYTKTPSASGGALSVSPNNPQSLGNVTVLASSPGSATFTISNTSASVSATGCTATLSNETVFDIVSNNCGSTIAAGGSCSLGVRGTPPSQNTFTTNLTVGCTNTGAGVIVQVSVTGVSGASSTPTSTPSTGSGSGSSTSFTPALSVAPATGTSLGAVLLNNTSLPATYTFSNTGTGMATGCVVALSPVSVFNLNSSSCGTNLGAGGSCSVSVTGVPTSAMSYGTTLTFSCANVSGQISRPISLSGYSSGGTGTTGGGSGGIGSGCFIAGTKIEMADGSFKAIEKIRMGDRVRGTGGGVNVVTKLFKIAHRGLKYGFNGGKAFFTDSHPFLSDRGWRSLNPILSSKESPGLAVLSMNPGDVLLTRNGSFRIHSLESVLNSETVFNFSTDGDHSYIADGYKVHNVQNKTSGGSGSTGFLNPSF